jgi:hypothetical protein
MTRITLTELLLTSTLAFAPCVVLAQTPETPEQRKAEQQAMRQELVQKIEQVKYEKMKTSLGLDEATATKFFEIYKPAEKEVQDIVKQRNEELKKLAQMMNGAKSDADVDPEMQKIRELNQKIENRELKLDGDLKPVFAPRQRARLLVFEHEFNKRLREEVTRHQAGKGIAPAMRNLRRQLRQERLKNMLLKHQAAGGKAPGEKR